MLDDCEREAMDIMFQIAERYKGQKRQKELQKSQQGNRATRDSVAVHKREHKI